MNRELLPWRICLGVTGAALLVACVVGIVRNDSTAGIVLCAMCGAGFLRMAINP